MMISGILLDVLVGGVGCLAVALLALAGVLRRLSPRGRVILGASLGASLALLLIVSLLATQLGALRTALAQQASPSHATLIALSADTAGLDTVTALNGHDGSIRWRHPLGLYLVAGTIADDTVYLAGFARPNQTQATLVARRLSDGAALWQVALPNVQQTPPQVIVAGDLVITLAQTSPAADGSAAYALIAIDRLAHATAWRVVVLNAPGLNGFSALATGSGLLFLGSDDGSVRALRLSDGAAAWSERISPPATATQPASWLGVVARGDTLIVYDSTGEVASLRQSDGATLWGHPLPPPSYSYYLQRVTLTSDNLYVCGVDTVTHARALMALNPLTGADRWSQVSACDRVAPVESGGYVYTLDPLRLTALRASDGALVWQGQPEETDLGYTTLQGDGGVVFAATTIANYRSLHVCGQWFPPGVSLCHSTQYIAALNGATSARYWRTSDSYIGLLGDANA